MTEEWGDVFQKLAKKGKLIRNNIDLSRLFAVTSELKPAIVSSSTIPFRFGTLFIKKKRLFRLIKIIKDY